MTHNIEMMYRLLSREHTIILIIALKSLKLTHYNVTSHTQTPHSPSTPSPALHSKPQCSATHPRHTLSILTVKSPMKSPRAGWEGSHVICDFTNTSAWLCFRPLNRREENISVTLTPYCCANDKGGKHSPPNDMTTHTTIYCTMSKGENHTNIQCMIIHI